MDFCQKNTVETSPDFTSDEEVGGGGGAEEERQLASEYDHGDGGGEHEAKPGVEVEIFIMLKKT